MLHTYRLQRPPKYTFYTGSQTLGEMLGNRSMPGSRFFPSSESKCRCHQLNMHYITSYSALQEVLGQSLRAQAMRTASTTILCPLRALQLVATRLPQVPEADPS